MPPAASGPETRPNPTTPSQPATPPHAPPKPPAPTPDHPSLKVSLNTCSLPPQGYARQIPVCPVTALDSHVLVLNRLWQPVNTCTARRAVTLVFLGHAHIVHRDEENNYSTHDALSWIGLTAENHPDGGAVFRLELPPPLPPLPQPSPQAP